MLCRQLIKPHSVPEDPGRNTHLLFEVTAKIKLVFIAQFESYLLYGF